MLSSIDMSSLSVGATFPRRPSRKTLAEPEAHGHHLLKPLRLPRKAGLRRAGELVLLRLRARGSKEVPRRAVGATPPRARTFPGLSPRPPRCLMRGAKSGRLPFRPSHRLPEFTCQSTVRKRRREKQRKQRRARAAELHLQVVRGRVHQPGSSSRHRRRRRCLSRNHRGVHILQSHHSREACLRMAPRSPELMSVVGQTPKAEECTRPTCRAAM